MLTSLLIKDMCEVNSPAKKVADHIAVTNNDLEFVLFLCLYLLAFLAFHNFTRPVKVFLKSLFNTLVALVSLLDFRFAELSARNVMSWSATGESNTLNLVAAITTQYNTTRQRTL